MQGFQLPGFTVAGEMGKELCMWVPWGPLCGVLIQALPFTGSVPLSEPVWDPGGPYLSLWGGGAVPVLPCNLVISSRTKEGAQRGG